MALNIKNAEAEQLANQLAALTGESKTAAVLQAIKDRLVIVQQQRQKSGLEERLTEIALHAASLPILDERTPEEMLYDDQGLPTYGLGRYFAE
jgi:antitoxin VapB